MLPSVKKTARKIFSRKLIEIGNSMRWLEKESGISRRKLTRMLEGETDINFDDAVKLAVIFNIDISEVTNTKLSKNIFDELINNIHLLEHHFKHGHEQHVGAIIESLIYKTNGELQFIRDLKPDPKDT